MQERELIPSGFVALERWHLPTPPSHVETLLRMVRALPPYPEVPRTLAHLAQRYRLAIISNTEDELITETVRGLGVPFTVITTEQAGAFKPDPRLFYYALARLECQPGEVLHVGAGNPTDMAPAFALGIPRVWINRARDVADAAKPPTRELPDLQALPACVADLVQCYGA